MNKNPRTGPRIRITRAKRKEPDASYVHTCQYCRVKFTKNIHFFRHMTSHHQAQQREATFQCNECQVIFNKKSTLDHHCQTHKIKSKSKCESCEITFKSRYCLHKHMKLKQILAENACVKCQKTFTTKDQLVKHVLNKHTNKNITFECDHCSLKFKAKQSLLTHLSRIHKRL